MKFGEVLVRQGLLTEAQVAEVLREQERTGEPFGVLCEEMFEIDPERIEEAWVTQYEAITRPIDPTAELFDSAAADIVTRRQAWQFRVLPIRFHGDELMMATAAPFLRRALRFATRSLSVPVYFVLADPKPLMSCIARRYPMAGLCADGESPCPIDEMVERLTLKG